MNLIFGLSRHTSKFNIVSKIIELVEKKPYSHCYVRFTLKNTDMIFQASGLQVNMMSYDEFCSINTPVYEYEAELADTNHRALIQWMLKKLGKPYSVAQLLRILLYKATGLKLGSDGQAEICSQLVTQLCQFLGLEQNVDADYNDPAAFQEFCATNMKRIL